MTKNKRCKYYKTKLGKHRHIQINTSIIKYCNMRPLNETKNEML